MMSGIRCFGSLSASFNMWAFAASVVHLCKRNQFQDTAIPPHTPGISIELRRLLLSCIDPDPYSRPTMKRIGELYDELTEEDRAVSVSTVIDGSNGVEES